MLFKLRRVLLHLARGAARCIVSRYITALHTRVIYHADTEYITEYSASNVWVQSTGMGASSIANALQLCYLSDKTHKGEADMLSIITWANDLLRSCLLLHNHLKRRRPAGPWSSLFSRHPNGQLPYWRCFGEIVSLFIEKLKLKTMSALERGAQFLDLAFDWFILVRSPIAPPARSMNSDWMHKEWSQQRPERLKNLSRERGRKLS